MLTLKLENKQAQEFQFLSAKTYISSQVSGFFMVSKTRCTQSSVTASPCSLQTSPKLVFATRHQNFATFRQWRDQVYGMFAAIWFARSERANRLEKLYFADI